MRKMTFFVFLFASFYGVSTLADITVTNSPSTTVANTVAVPPASNEVTVSVIDRTTPALQLALQSAFSQAMIQISGKANVMSQPAIQQALSNVTQWVQSYSYVKSPNENPQLPSTLQLQVVFDKAGLQQLLSSTVTTASKNNTSSSDQQSTLYVMVTGIRNIADYVQMMQAMRAKTDVEKVAVKNMESDNVLLQVKISGNSAQFQQSLTADNNFKSTADAQSLDQTQLQYYWMGNQA